MKNTALLLCCGLVVVSCKSDSSRSDTNYPLAELVAERHPILKLEEDELRTLMAEDGARLSQAADELMFAVGHARSLEKLLQSEKPEELSTEQRTEIRMAWWHVLEPVLAIDAIKRRYKGWYGIDFLRHRPLHSRAYALAYGALCVQVSGGQSFMRIVGTNERIHALLNEAIPEQGVPAGTFQAVRNRLVRSRDFSYVPVGAAWFDSWIGAQLMGNPDDLALRSFVLKWRENALAQLNPESVTTVAKNKAQLLATDAFVAWLPLQTEISTWAGDVRFVPEGRRLIKDNQIEELRAKLRPGDILVERRNWYLSNVGLPGFWPHSALYAGTQEELKKTFDADPGVTAKFGGTFSEYLARTHPVPWKALSEKDEHGKPRAVIEAVGAGVVARSLEHSCGADYAAAMRPTLPLVDIAAALDRAMAWFGRPYDFNFDFATDDRLVCSELVMKAYRGDDTGKGGLTIPFETVAGRRVVAPTGIVAHFARLRSQAEHPLSFVAFLQGREKDGKAVWSDEAEFAASAVRPKWDIAQP